MDDLFPLSIHPVADLESFCRRSWPISQMVKCNDDAKTGSGELQGKNGAQLVRGRSGSARKVWSSLALRLGLRAISTPGGDRTVGSAIMELRPPIGHPAGQPAKAGARNGPNDAGRQRPKEQPQTGSEGLLFAVPVRGY